MTSPLSTFSLGKDASFKVSGQHCFYAGCNDAVEFDAFKENNKQFLRDNNMVIYFDDRNHWLYIYTHPDSTKHNDETGKRDLVKENITFMNRNLKTVFTEFEVDRKTKTQFVMHCENEKQALFIKLDGSRYTHPMLSITIDLKNYKQNQASKRATCFVSSLTHPKTHQRLINGMLKSCDISYIADVDNINTSSVKDDAVADADGKIPRQYRYYHLATNAECNPYLQQNTVSRPTTPVGTKASLYSDENWDYTATTTQQIVRNELHCSSPVFANLQSGYKEALNKSASNPASNPIPAPTTPKTKPKKQESLVTPVAIPTVLAEIKKVEVPAPSVTLPLAPLPKLLNSTNATQTTTKTFSGKNHNLPTSLSINFENGEVTLTTTTKVTLLDDNINLEELAEYLCNYFVNTKCKTNVAQPVAPVPKAVIPPVVSKTLSQAPITPFNSINIKPPTSPQQQMDWSQMSDDDTEYASSDEEVEHTQHRGQIRK